MHARWIIPLALLILLAGCSLVPPTPELPLAPADPTLTASPTVPPLPTVTPWSTKTPTPTPLACWVEGGTLTADTVPTTLLKNPVEMLVYLPPCYADLPETDYPVIYLIHGQSFDQTQWGRLGFTALMDAYLSSGFSTPYIIVMPYVADWGGPDSVPFGRAMIEEVIPYIEAHYRARPEREWRKVGGISRGASWALHLGLKYWDQFSAVGGHSAPVFYDDAPYVPGWLDAIPPGQAPAIFLDYAVSDQGPIRDSSNYLMAELDNLGIPYTFSSGPGSHTEDYWSSRMEDYFLFYVDEETTSEE
jgi:enterochelin esterase-like enzyme